MSNNLKKLQVLILVLVLVITASAAACVSVSAAAKGEITIDSVRTNAGKTVELTVIMTVNPGIATVDFEVEFDDDILTLTAVKDEGFIAASEAQYAGPAHSDNLVSPYHLSWCNDVATADITKTGEMVTLTFKVDANAPDGDYAVSIIPDSAEIYDCHTKPVDFEFIDGTVTIVSEPTVILGDSDSDSLVTIFDATAIQRYLAEIPVQDFNEAAADADEDGGITIFDATAIQRYLAEMISNENIGKPIKA